MTHYEERLEKDIGSIKSRVTATATAVEKALADAIQAVLTRDRDLANSIILGDLPINREIRSIDRKCHGFVALHLPSAGHLRFVSSVLRLIIEIERVGDYAVAIAREAVQLSTEPPVSVARDIDLMGDQTWRLFHQAMKSFNEASPDLARGTKELVIQVEGTYRKVFADLLREAEERSRPVKDIFALLVVFNYLGRVADQAKNICEDTIFATTGETKGKKTYRILFIDEKDNGLGQMAKAYGRKAFPNSGRFESAGWAPGEALDPQVEAFMEGNGLDAGGQRPDQLVPSEESLNDYHVLVGLHPDTDSHIPEIPFHTVLLNWSVGESPEGLDRERTRAHLEESYKQLTLKIRELMETLRGDTGS